MDKKAMLKLGTRKQIAIVAFVAFVISCQKKEIDLRKQRKVYFIESLKQVSVKEYWEIYDSAKDTIANWNKNKLPYMGVFDNGIILDSLICFNKEANKCLMALSFNNSSSDEGDGMEYFYGVKAKDKWYFLEGSSIVLPREYYQKDIHKPLTYDKLQDIAMQEVFSGYLKQSLWDKLFNPDKYEINPNAFREFTQGYGNCKTAEDFDKAYLNQIHENWLSKFRPLKDDEITYDYNHIDKTMKIKFPIHLPTKITDNGIYDLDIWHWKTEKNETEQQIIEKEPDWIYENHLNSNPKKIYSRVLKNIETNTTYTLRINYFFNVNNGHTINNPVFFTHFTVK